MKRDKLGARAWSSILIFGLFGQIAWVVENMYFNVFLYNTIDGNPNAIAWMVGASAAVATLTTMVMGALSDKIGRRKIFITTGYILWGLSTLSFGFISTDNVAALLPTANAVTVAVIAVIVMDCVMTFFGSTANDGAFNAWVTDITTENNRGKVEGILATLPLLALLLIFGAFDGLTQSGNWPLFFFLIGGIITLGGILGLFLIKETRFEKPKENYWKTVVYGFRWSTIKENKLLYLSLVTMALFGIATQIYMPYFIIYFQLYLGLTDYALLLGGIILGASIASIIVARFINAKNKNHFFFPSLFVMIAGFLAIFFLGNYVSIIWVGIAGFVMMTGNLVFTSTLSAKTRDYTPADKAGHFQGIRMIFYVLIPMIIGPSIGALIISSNNQTFTELGIVKHVPTPAIFLGAAICSLLILIPLAIALAKEKKAKA